MVNHIRIGIAGTGFAGRFHLENFPETGAEVVGVTSTRPESRDAFAVKHGVRSFTSVAEMLPEIDVLDICTPPSSHGEYILQAAAAGKHVIVEKPFTGFYGSPECYNKRQMLDEVVAEVKRLREAVRSAGIILGYAENFVYAPSIQKEREIVEKTRAQILRMTGEESHSGSHSPVYGVWSVQGGGSLIAKGCHPLGAILYLKRKEGLARIGKPIRPVAVSARTHSITRLPAFEDKGFLRTKYQDTEDYALLHVVFEDGMVADIMASELVLGGIYDFVEVFANNHRTRCRMSPVNVIDVYNPKHEQFKDLYLVEKITTNEGWIPASPEEGWSLGYGKELRNFVDAVRTGWAPESDLDLAIDTTLTLYAGYVSADEKGKEVEVPWIDPRG
jgi:predicted dehydrogenase